MQRPNLTNVEGDVLAYIEYLENQLLNALTSRSSHVAANRAPAELAEEPTSVNVVTLSAAGLIKRTPRHLYQIQRRSGMGVFDMEVAEDDYPAHVLVGDELADVVIVTNFARVFRLPIAQIPERPVRSKGEPMADLLDMHPKETASIFLTGEGSYLTMLTPRGYVIRRNRHYIRNGANMYDVSKHGAPIAATWNEDSDDLFVSTVSGHAIRFWSKQVPERGCLAIRPDDGDQLLGITAVPDDGTVLMVGHDGKGTVRHMDGFRKNKAPGAGSKAAFKSEKMITAAAIGENDDVFIISRLGKMIRFHGNDIPVKTGIVQGVNCMTLRADEVTAVGIAKM